MIIWQSGWQYVLQCVSSITTYVLECRKLWSFIFLYFQTWNMGPFQGFCDHTCIRHTVGLLWTSDQPVAETSTCTGQHNIYLNTWDKHPCPERDSNPRPQQPSGRRPTPLTARPLGSANSDQYTQKTTFKFLGAVPDAINIRSSHLPNTTIIKWPVKRVQISRQLCTLNL
jgi:hypothetical protein